MSTILEVRNLHIHFETQDGIAKVINGVDFSLEVGETTALVGETGCGKSVTVKTIMGLLPEAKIPEGEILFKDRDILSLPNEVVHEIRGNEMSMIMQDPMSSLNPVFTIETQMIDILKWKGKRRLGFKEYLQDKFQNQDELRTRAIEMLERVDIPSPERVMKSYPAQLSGGMRQRVMIAMALLSEPDLLIADEPGTALDVTTEAKVLELLQDLIDEFDTTVLYITHDLGIAREISDHINVMYAGDIVERAPAVNLFNDPKHPYTYGLLDSIPKLTTEMGSGIDGHLPSYTDPPAACRFASRCPYAAEECTEIYPYRRAVSPTHDVGCHLYDGTPSEKRHEQLHEQTNVNIGDPPADFDAFRDSVERQIEQ